MEQSEIENIKIETKKLLDEFSKALSVVKEEESNVERELDKRKEKNGKTCEAKFRKIMLENAPIKDDNFIIAEKKKW